MNFGKMTVRSNPIRKIFSRFFPKRYFSEGRDSHGWDFLNESQKKDLAFKYLAKGELALLQGNLGALPLFETASQLAEGNPEIWYRQGLAFFEYGSEEGKEKALLLASKHFKWATQLDPTFCDAYIAWGNTLLQLGKCYCEHHFHVEAKEKYEKAISLSEGRSSDVLAELYWDYGIVWTELAAHSGEALDVKLAIEAFQTSRKLQSHPSPEFLQNCGKAHLEMGLLINDSRLYFEAVQYLIQALDLSPHYFDGWETLAEVYSQLYLNTVDEKYITKASHAFTQAVKISTRNSDTWLSWAQILAESGRVNRDIRQLRQSVENCARAYTLDAKNPLIIAQWVESLSWLGDITGRLDLLIEAEQKIQKASEEYVDDPDLWHAYGVNLLCFGKYYEDGDYFEMAIEKLQYGLSIDRTSAEHWHTLALVHKLYADITLHEDLLERANRFFSRAIDLKPSCPSLIFDAAITLLQFSELTQDLPSLQKAIFHLETLLQSHKEVVIHNPEWLVEYGKCLEWLSEFSLEETHLFRALDVFSHVLLIDPDFPGMHYRMAQCNTLLGHQTGETDFYKRAIHFFRLAVRQDEENEQVWLDWGLCLMHLATHTMDPTLSHALYTDAEQKVVKAGKLGSPAAHYSLACLYSLLDRTDEAMNFIHKALSSKTLPPLDEMLEDEWLENLRITETFAQFLNALETKLQTREQ